MNEQPLDLRASLQEIWRRRLLVIVVAVLCGLGGLVYGLLSPAHQSAVALVLLPPSTASNASSSGASGNSGAAGSGVSTDAVIAISTPVLAAAGAKVSPPLGASEVKNLVTVTPLSGQILEIQAQAPSGEYAEQLTNAVAAASVDYMGQLAASSAGAGVATLQHQSSSLSKQINDLQTQIDTVYARITNEGPGTAAGQQDLNLLSSLKNEQNQVSLQLNTVTNQITNAQVSAGSTGNSARILQRATAQPESMNGFLIAAGIVGFAIGLLVSVAYVILRIQRGQRLRLRDDIARAAGAPVIATLEAPTCTTASAWRDLLEGQQRATTEWALRHVFRTLGDGSGRRPSVRVISFAGDLSALTTGPRLALQAASSGTATALVFENQSVLPVDRSLEPLRAAFTGAEPVGRGLPFTVERGDTDGSQSQLLVSLVVFDGKSTNLTSSDAVNLLSISPNSVTADELAQLALQATDSGSVLEGVVVVNPDQTDNTTGLTGNDTVRVLASGPRTGADDDELVQFETQTSKVSVATGRLPRRER